MKRKHPVSANCWRLNEKNEESRDKIKQYTRTLDDDDMVEHLDILDRKHNLLRNGQPWELENIHGPGQAPLKIKKGKF